MKTTFALFVSICFILAANCQAQSSVTISKWENPDFTPASQETLVWCWAASMSAALKSKGVDLSQQDIVIATFGSPVPRPLDDPSKLTKLTSLLNRRAFENGELNLTMVTAPAFRTTWEKFKAEIENTNPYVVGYWEGPSIAHCVVIYGAETDAAGSPVAYKIWDPMPKVGNRTENIAAFDRNVFFYVLVKDAKLKPTSTSARSSFATQNSFTKSEVGPDISESFQKIFNARNDHFSHFLAAPRGRGWYDSSLNLPECSDGRIFNSSEHDMASSALFIWKKSNLSEDNALVDTLAKQVATVLGTDWKQKERIADDGRKLVFFHYQNEDFSQVNISTFDPDLDGHYQVKMLISGTTAAP